MASTPEMIRLMRHAADLLDGIDPFRIADGNTHMADEAGCDG